MDTILAGIQDALTVVNVAYIFAGVAIGIVVGAIPGLNAPMALAVAVPLTFYMSPLSAIAFLIAIAKGGAFGGAISAILLNTPGSPEATSTAFDGYPLAQRGKGLKALKMALYASFTGDTFSDLVLFTVAAPLAILALRMGPPELAGVFAFSLTIIAGLAGRSLLRGLIAALLGAFVACVGLDIETAQPRLTFGYANLIEGVPLIPMSIGLLALSEILIQIEAYTLGRNPPAKRISAFSKSIPAEDRRVSFKEYFECRRTLVRSALIGTSVGAVPGIGAIIAGFLGYGAAKRASRTPEEFGKGKLEGIAATEAANSAVNGANLIPLLSLGIPGSLSAAILIGAFLIHGVNPGPLIFKDHGQLVYGIFAAMFLANFANFIVGNIGLRLFALIVNVPKTVILPVVVVLCVAGAYSNGNTMFAVAVMMIFAVVGYFMRKLDYPFATFIIGFALGGTFEEAVRQTVVLFGRRPEALLSRPIFMAFVAMTVFVIARIAWRGWRDTQRRRAVPADGPQS
ncbi:tripartite tricarboxylate transporter permease [Polymorphum gilvum]|uniref:Tricarboxylate transporter family protein n=1 Tax=Polymorphum gilvum (strain LMG 25793 / CGMCC 1.9160 / SL003B-26A1) TaxID=991905 RepID=F2IZI9_POLGS|nr:tripartite tricarboxylate transporter permease [Polymorphum gilvum]ADZ69546.1 Tricarboxylate transporter family protein [Polymorphum gilvum SL003B-26A1]